MASFSYTSRDSKNYSNSLSIDTSKKIYNYNPDNRQVTIYEYNPDKSYEISIYIFIDILNSIEISKNALCICNSIGCDDINIRQNALDFGLTYKNIFNGDNTTNNAKKILEIINCDVKPKINIKTYKSVCYVKWKIYEINEKNKIKNKNRNNTTVDNLSEWIGVLAGFVLYFDEIDVANHNTTRYSVDICKPLTIKEI